MKDSYARKALIITLLFVATQAIISCQGRTGPMGPPGYDGQDGSVYVSTLFYTIQPRDWKLVDGEDNRWIDSRYSDLITQNVIDNGYVLFYLRSINGDDYWSLLPLTKVEYDNNERVFSTEYKAWYGLEDLELQFYDSHPTDPLPPDWDVEIKVVVVEGSTTFIDKFKKMNHSDYDAVINILNQENKKSIEF